MDYYTTVNGRSQVVQHYPRTAAKRPVQPPYRMGFPDIKQAKQHKTKHYPGPAPWRGRHSRQITDDLIPDDAAMVMDSQAYRGPAAAPDSQEKHEAHHPQINRQRQCLHGYIYNDSNRRSRGTRQFRYQAGTETQRQQVHGVFQQLGRWSIILGCHGGNINPYAASGAITTKGDIMYKVFGDILSGNCYKIKLLMGFLGINHEWIHIDILAGESRTDTFRSMNSNMKVPVLDLDDGRYLSESNAILNFLAHGTDFLPDTAYERARVLQWQFFEQYSHEPFIATARFINKYLGLPQEREQEYYGKHEGGYKALSIMEQQLKQTRFLTGDSITIADISLYAYTHVAHEGGFNLGEYSSIKRWFGAIEALPGYISMAPENARS